MKKSINIQGEGNNKYITIFEVRAHVIDRDEVVTTERFLNKADAEKHQAFCYDVHSNLYDIVFIREQMVWC